MLAASAKHKVAGKWDAMHDRYERTGRPAGQQTDGGALMDGNDFSPEPTSTGIRLSEQSNWLLAIRELDNGCYDRNLPKGMDVLACIMEAVESNWIVLSIEKQIIVWRWLVVTIFLSEEQEKNGTVEIQNDEGGIDTAVIYSNERGALSVYPAPVVLLSRITLRPSLSRNTGAKKITAGAAHVSGHGGSSSG
jgi:hypothetical protein